MSDPMDVSPARASKRIREIYSDDSDDAPARKRIRVAGMEIGYNCRTYNPPLLVVQNKWSIMGRLPEPSNRSESPTQFRRLWQNRAGESYQDSPERIQKEEGEKWLASNTWWKHGLNRYWKGVKVLGVGGFGLVGLWEHARKDGDVKRVVVKQSRGKNRALKKESEILRHINDTGSHHVVRMLKQYHVDRGKGTSKWDPNWDYVSRIYLEYCEGGDMNSLMKKIARYTNICVYTLTGLTVIGIPKPRMICSPSPSSGRYGSAWPGACACYRMATRTSTALNGRWVKLYIWT
jgi:hypothetical protein